MAKSRLSEKINNAITVTTTKDNFVLQDYKKSKNLVSNTKYKPTEYLHHISDAVKKELSLKGFPIGFITLLRGHSNTGKTTSLLEGIKSSQLQGRLPVIIITEMKWSWQHAMDMGIQVSEELNEETGELEHVGNFIYIDRSSLRTIEDVAAFIGGLFQDQSNGKLPYGLDIFWDSIGSIPCQQSLDSKKNNNEWNAGAMSVQFAGWINQQIGLSRKEGYPYTNSMIAINKIWMRKPDFAGGQPTMMNSCGDKMKYDAVYQIRYGGIISAGGEKLTATRKGKTIIWGRTTKVELEKDHINGLSTNGTVIVTPHGFIENTPSEIEKYKRTHSSKWESILGGSDIDFIEVPDDEVDTD